MKRRSARPLCRLAELAGQFKCRYKITNSYYCSVHSIFLMSVRKDVFFK